MNQYLKQRLVGASVLVILGIIFLPMIMDKPVSREKEPDVTNIQIFPDEKKQPVQTIPAEVISRYEESEVQQKLPEQAAQQKEVAKTEKARVENKPESKPESKPIEKPEKTDHQSEGSDHWAVQMGSFSSKENANRLVERLKSQKFPAYFEDVESNGKTVYRVRVGPFNSRSKTEEMKQKLDQEEKLKTLIVTLH